MEGGLNPFAVARDHIPRQFLNHKDQCASFKGRSGHRDVPFDYSIRLSKFLNFARLRPIIEDVRSESSR
jgi:hypothetical protein